MDIERTMEFILNQQAKFAAGMEEMKQEMKQAQVTFRSELAEMQRREDAEHARLRTLIAQLADQVITLARHTGEFEDRVNNSLLALSEAQRHSEEKLNALIAVVDGMQRGRQGQ